ncbi:regulatory GntR family protein [Streptomyces sp. KhCrAH-43]|uniref:GntR family transcriptional regulator n=1 Tax=unclassified Streptomyces TaxID=2593676 RepID=UPI000DBA86AB|nr:MULTISPECIES: GntR family transcriptional regulator [unclassified Streptomyces]MYX67399.1 GntR family transcriptional regulator [Streptomyces sp. SID8373]RAJ53751.1 regulatory GntR family protein [Streptomyces sp. KhCrAH-43]
MPSPPPGRTALYRYYGAGAQLLYIGISNDPDFRWKSHLYRDSKWASLVTSRVDEWFGTRSEAEEAEVAAIKSEQPRFNGAHNFTEAPFSPDVWSRCVGPRKCEDISARIQAELSSGSWRSGMRVPSASQIAAKRGTSVSTTAKALRPFIRNGVLGVHGGRGVFVNPYTPDRPEADLRPAI